MWEKREYSVFNTDAKIRLMKGTRLEIEKLTGLSRNQVERLVDNCTAISGRKSWCERLQCKITARKR